MVYKHFIAVSSIYSKGIRIAWHYSSETFDSKVIQTFLDSYKKKHGDLQLGIHRLATYSPDWQSVIDADKYFKDLILVEDSNDFIQIVSKDQQLNATDIAKYILSVLPMTHLKLQKLIYLTYEKFLLKTGVPLFKDEIYAWKHGPVVESVYETYKPYGSEVIPYEEDDTVIIETDKLKVSPSFMRIVTSNHSELTLTMIHSVLVEFSELSAWELVDITHREGSPWNKVYQPGMNKRITEDVILSNSYNLI